MSSVEAGRELDALIAEKVMGWQRYGAMRYGKPIVVMVAKHSDCWNYTRSQADAASGSWEPTNDPVTERLTPFSTDIAAAWQVVEKFRGDKRLLFELRTAGRVGPMVDELTTYAARFIFLERDFSEAETAPLAICRAALAAVGGTS